MKKEAFFERRQTAVLAALLAVFTWGCAFPLIKLGFDAFRIAADDTGGKTLFAGLRFSAAGLLTLLAAKGLGRPLATGGVKNVGWLLLLGIVNTALHYFFFYIGLSNSSGSRSAVLDSLGTFLLVLLACVCFRDEHMTVRKLVGCVLGFSGILLLHIGTEQAEAFSLQGDGMIVLSAVCSAVGGILTRVVTRRMDALFATGVSLTVGGVLLVAAGLALGGTLPRVTLSGLLILGLLVLVSTVGFSLYNQLIRFHPVSEIAVFNAFIPAVGAMLSCLILGEPFYARYFGAALLIALGIYIVNRREKPKPGRS
ncbi:MAG: DMT family transporter [Acutalibacteraceae bacterium]